jgi:hypothetical protein
MNPGMRVRSLVAAVALMVSFGVGGGIAVAGPKKEIYAKIKEAMESYDSMDYDAAKKLLTEALTIAKKAKLEKDPAAAKAHLDMGIVEFVNSDQDGAKVEFVSAVQIDPKIQIDPAYKSADMAKLLEQARSESKGGGSVDSKGGGEGKGGGGEEPVDMTDAEPAGGTDCGSVKGVQHKIIDSAKPGKAVPIEALVGSDVDASKVAVMYRAEGATAFTEIKLKKEGECKYTGAIPGAAMRGSLIHYFVGAFNDVGKQVAGKGSEGSPNIIELAAGGGGGGGGDNEDPIGSGGGGGDSDVGGTVNGSTTVNPKAHHVLIAISGGPGFGYVTGETEGMNQVKNCCIGSSLVVLQPELGYFINPHMSIGLVARIGIPIGANVEGHATAAPGGLLRLRYALGAGGNGLRFLGQVGVGVMRNTIPLDNNMPGMDTDVVAQGPILAGGGIGYAKRLSGSVAFVADASALLGIAAFAMPGLSPKFNTGFGADLSIGLQFGL